MKYMKIFDYLPGKTKTVFITALFTVLSLQAKQYNPRAKQDYKGKQKLATFNSLYGTSLTSTYIVKPVSNQNAGNVKELAKNTGNDTTNIVPANKTYTEKEYINENVKIVVGKKSVKYIYPDGSTELREGGTLPWRNKNPGALRRSGLSVGKANGFAVFESEEIGNVALKALLRGENYRNLNIKTALFKYAPPHENDTKKYQSDMKRLTGLDLNRKLCDLNDDEFELVVKTIKKLEGWTPGKLTRTEALGVTDTLIKSVQQNIR